MKKRFWKCIDYVYKHRLIAFFVAIGIATSFILYGVLANDDEYANDLEVKNATIALVADGGNYTFDATDGVGKDSNGANGVLRNFDAMAYRVNYTLALKQGDSISTQIEGRNVIVDVILPNTFSTQLSSDNQSGDGYVNAATLDENYNYYEFVIDNVSTTTSSEPATFEFALWDVNSKVPDASFSPIILVKEATDNNYKAVSEMSSNEREALVANLPANVVACDSNALHCTTTMTGYYDYNVEVYSGIYNNGASEAETGKNYPVGFAVSLPNNPVGLYVPNSVSFDVAYAADNANINVTYVADSFVNYKDNSKHYTIYNNNDTPMPETINNLVSYNNGTVTVSNLALSDGVVGTVSFELNSTRVNPAVETDGHITVTTSNLKVGDTVIKANGGSTTIEDKYSKFVGPFSSYIGFYKEKAQFDNWGSSEEFMNYNQQFVINEKLSYAIRSGNALDEFNNYIKVDPDAFTIYTDRYDKPSDMVLRFGHGLWTSEYFELTGVSGCPTNINSLTKEQMMNLYGGPCLRAKNTVLWNDDETELPVIIVNGLAGQAGSDEINFNPGTYNITLYGKVKDNVNLINATYQISTLSTGMFEGDLYYLSNTSDRSAVGEAKNPNNFVKANYDFAGRQLVSGDANFCGTAECFISGKSLGIIPFTVTTPSIHAYYNDVERSSFYDYPIEWRINVTAASDDESIEYTAGAINVTVSDPLVYLYAETIVNGVRVRKEPTLNQDVTGGKYLRFDFTEDEINNGAINTLSVFTDIQMNTKSGTQKRLGVAADLVGRVVKGTEIIRLVDPRPFDWDNGIKSVRSQIVNLYNSSTVATYGNASPRYVEKNQSYTYTMKAYNNSSIGDGSNTGYGFENATMYYMLPYIEDSNYKTYEKTFTNKSFKVKLAEALPANYKAYYTTANTLNLIEDVYNGTNPDSVTSWTEWTNPTTDVVATAIKVVRQNDWDLDTYFVSENGVNVIVTPVNNAQADSYYNGFLMTVNRPNNYVEPCSGDDCSGLAQGARLYYRSSSSLVEVYSRQISGFVFEDYNYDNLYETIEDTLKDVVVELYKLNNSEYNETSDASNPIAYIDTTRDTLVATKATSSTGVYEFTGLEPGYYYVLFRYNGEKYTPSEKYGGLLTGVANPNSINSKAIARPDIPDEAVSDILTLSSSASSNSRYINLGLRIRKEFGVEINKYITRVDFTSSQGNKVFEFDKKTKVNIDIKNMKNNKFRVTYSFDIVNTKYYPGYIGIIADLLPTGMTFDNSLEENMDWTLSDGVLYYTGLQNRLLLPGEKQYFKLVLDLETNKGGTYLNIVAAQQPILMGEDLASYDFSEITVDTGDDTSSGDPNAGGIGATDNGSGEGD